MPLAGCTLTQSKARVTAVASAVQSAEAVKETVAVPPSCAMTGAVSSVSGMTMAGSSGSGLGVGFSLFSSSLQAARSRQQQASPADSITFAPQKSPFRVTASGCYPSVISFLSLSYLVLIPLLSRSYLSLPS